MEITLAPAQSGELKTLVLALVNAQNQGSTTGEIEVGATKVKYASNEVEFTLSEAE